MDAFSQANVMRYNEVNRVVPDLFHLKKSVILCLSYYGVYSTTVA